MGRNGTGKSTLLRAVAGRAVPGLPPDVQVLHVEQEVVGDATPVLDAVLRCDVERWDLLEEERALQAAAGKDGDRLAAIYARLEAIDAFAQEAKAASILAVRYLSNTTTPCTGRGGGADTQEIGAVLRRRNDAGAHKGPLRGLAHARGAGGERGGGG